MFDGGANGGILETKGRGQSVSRCSFWGFPPPELGGGGAGRARPGQAAAVDLAEVVVGLLLDVDGEHVDLRGDRVQPRAHLTAGAEPNGGGGGLTSPHNHNAPTSAAADFANGSPLFMTVQGPNLRAETTALKNADPPPKQGTFLGKSPTLSTWKDPKNGATRLQLTVCSCLQLHGYLRVGTTRGQFNCLKEANFPRWGGEGRVDCGL